MKDKVSLGKPRRLWIVPVTVLVVTYILVNTCYTLFSSRLDQARPILTIWVIAAAVSLPPLLGARQLRPGQVLMLAWASVAVTLHLIPVWQGYSCWAPELLSLLGMLMCGGVAAAAVAFGRLGDRVLSSKARTATLVQLVVVLVFGVVAVWAMPSSMSLQVMCAVDPAPGARLPSVSWQTGVSREITSRLVPITWRQSVGEAQPTLAVDGTRMVTITAYNRASVRDAATGKRLGELTLTSSESGPAMDRQSFPWHSAEIHGDLYAVRGMEWVDVYSLDSMTHLSRIGQAPALLQLDQSGIVVDSYGWLRAYTPHGSLLWEAKPLDFAGEYPQILYPTTPYGATSFPRVEHAAKTAAGWVVGGTGGVKALDRNGMEQWRFATGEFFCGLAVEPQGDVVYIATLTGPEQPTVRALREGREIWRFTLPDEVMRYQWAVLPQGLAILDQRPGLQAGANARDTTVTLLSRDSGRAAWTRPLPQMYLPSMKATPDGLIVVDYDQILRLSVVDGHIAWCLSSQRPYDFNAGLISAGAPLLIRTIGGIAAVDPESGQVLWQGQFMAGWRETVCVDGVLYSATLYSALAIVP